MYSTTPNNISFQSQFENRFLTPNQAGTLKNGTLQLLDEVGIHFPSQRALEIFADHGARVNMQTQMVRISPDLVTQAMASAPRSFVLAGREERFDLLLDGSRSYICTAGTGVHVIDPQTRRQRASCKDDLARTARICDALSSVSFMWSTVTSQDRGVTAPLHDCHAMLTNTLKHVRGGISVPPYLAHYIVEMATIVSGDEQQRRRRPIINANICTISPLAHDHNGIESALIYAEAGIPVSFMAMTTMGATAPVTPLGSIVTGDAEVVSGMVLLQLAFPGTPVFHSVLVSQMNFMTGEYIAKVPLPINMMSVALGHAWNIPCLGGARMGSDATDIGWQSGMECALGAATLAMASGEVCGHIGLLGGAMIMYPEQMILDHELCLTVHGMYQLPDFKPQDMALDVISGIGPRNDYLSHAHTVEHLRELRVSPLLHPRPDQTAAADPRAAAIEEYNRLDQEHHPEPLPSDVLTELERVVATAEEQAKNIA